MARSKEQNAAIKLRTRNKIISNGIRIFAQNGVKNTSVDAITTASGCSHGTFYNYFESVENMYEYCVKNYLKDFYNGDYSFNLDSVHTVDELFNKLKQVLDAPIDVKYFFIMICQDCYRATELRNEDYINLKKSINQFNPNVSVENELLRCALVINGLLHASVTQNIDLSTISTTKLKEIMLTY